MNQENCSYGAILFDTHAHYDDEKFDLDRDKIIMEAKESGVAYILNAASTFASNKECILLTQKYDVIYCAVGIHPHNINELNEENLEVIYNLAKNNKKVVAIGEIGLDYYYDFNPREDQKIGLAKQINMAKELNLPIIIHNRDSHEDIMDIIKNERAKEVGGVFHCYSGSVDMAKELIKNNFYISVGGPITFKNPKKLIEVVEYLPIERLLIETDCPYLTPEPFRGKRNDSKYVRLVAEKIAQIKGTTFEEVSNRTLENAKYMFGI